MLLHWGQCDVRVHSSHGRASVNLGSNPSSTAGEGRGPGAAFLDLSGLICNQEDNNNSEIIKANEYQWSGPPWNPPSALAQWFSAMTWHDFPGISSDGLDALMWMGSAHPVLSMNLSDVCTQSESQKMEGLGDSVSFVELFGQFHPQEFLYLITTEGSLCSNIIFATKSQCTFFCLQKSLKAYVSGPIFSALQVRSSLLAFSSPSGLLDLLFKYL